MNEQSVDGWLAGDFDSVDVVCGLAGITSCPLTEGLFLMSISGPGPH